MGERRKNGSSGESLDELPALVARLGEDVMTLVESKLGLLKVEVQEDVLAYLRGTLAFAVGSVVAAVGFLLFNVAVAVLVGHTLAPANLVAPVRYALGFLFVGAVDIVMGVGLAKRAERRMSDGPSGA